MRILEGLKPERVFYYFEELTKIPRCSHNEKMVSDYLVGVGHSLGLETIQDEALNVIIKKPASPGYENKPTAVLQGHMDMVCEKRDDSLHQFETEGIKIEQHDDFVMAPDTTLGADNGIAVAMCLALLEDKNAHHPSLEVLVTTNEETGLTGAAALDPKHISGRILINIDSEEEGTILVSCAGGQRDMITIETKWKELKKDKKCFKVTVSGLLGGHSGMEINKGRGNSNRILGRVLNRLNEKVRFNLGFIQGGSLSNAIPRYAHAVIAMDSNYVDKARETIGIVEKEIMTELGANDPGLVISFEETDKMDKVLKNSVKNKVITALMLIPTGVQSMSGDIEGLVESSNNLGVVKTLEDSITMECSIRSSKGSLKKNISNQMKLIADALYSRWNSTSSYPAWEYRKDSYIRDVFKESYKELYNGDLKVEAIHAGLECGLFDEKWEGMDMVSFGPNMAGVHAPGERLSISSTERTYNLLLKVLENIK